MFQNILGCGDGCGGDNLLWFFLLLVCLACFCGGENNGLLGGFGGLGGCGGDNLLWFFLLLAALFCFCGNNEERCGC